MISRLVALSPNNTMVSISRDRVMWWRVKTISYRQRLATTCSFNKSTPSRDALRIPLLHFPFTSAARGWQPFSLSGNFKMADSDVEINVDDVCDSMAADHGVEVQTIIQGQAPIAGQTDELDFMVQEEVETTTDGDTLTVELDPVDNVIIALQSTDNLQGGGHFEDQNGGLGDQLNFGQVVTGVGEHGRSSGRKRRSGGGGGGGGGGGEEGGKIGGGGSRGSGGGPAKKKARRMKKGAVRFANRQIPAALSASSSAAKDAREANEASFVPDKRPRKWKKRSVPVTTLDGQFAVSMWSTGTCG